MVSGPSLQKKNTTTDTRPPRRDTYLGLPSLKHVCVRLSPIQNNEERMPGGFALLPGTLRTAK